MTLPKLSLVLGLCAVAALALGLRADDKKADMHAAHFDTCAKACADCMRECESCAHHCAHLLADGKKEHMTTLGTCTDCAEFCAAAAKITSRHGPMATNICDSCAKACDTCAAACEKMPNDEHMAKCAKACRDCAKACREMVKHVSENK